MAFPISVVSMKTIYLKTERIIIRKLKKDGSAAFCRNMSTRRVYRFTSDIAWTMERTADYIHLF